MGAAGSVAHIPPSGIPAEQELAIFMELKEKFQRTSCASDEEYGKLYNELEAEYREEISKALESQLQAQQKAAAAATEE